MREIKLTQNQVAVVDDDDYERLNQFKWCISRTGKLSYAMRNSPRIKGKRHRIYMHHAVIGTPPNGLQVDHKNGQGVDNRKENLRIVTPRQNVGNKKNITTTSKHPGIAWNKGMGKWVACIYIKRKPNHLGYFIDEKEAFEAYKKAVNAIGEKVIGEV
jgi:hypothetical protein